MLEKMIFFLAFQIVVITAFDFDLLNSLRETGKCIGFWKNFWRCIEVASLKKFGRRQIPRTSKMSDA